jgi:hypothetical protein
MYMVSQDLAPARTYEQRHTISVGWGGDISSRGVKEIGRRQHNGDFQYLFMKGVAAWLGLRKFAGASRDSSWDKERWQRGGGPSFMGSHSAIKTTVTNKETKYGFFALRLLFYFSS